MSSRHHFTPKMPGAQSLYKSAGGMADLVMPDWLVSTSLYEDDDFFFSSLRHNSEIFTRSQTP